MGNMEEMNVKNETVMSEVLDTMPKSEPMKVGVTKSTSVDDLAYVAAGAGGALVIVLLAKWAYKKIFKKKPAEVIEIVTPETDGE